MTGPQPTPWIASIAPYVAGRATADDGRAVVKLSANENPFGPPAGAVEAMREAVGQSHRYPDPAAHALREAIGKSYGLEPERIIHGNGSDELLHLAAGCFAGPGDEVLMARHSFSVYPIVAKRAGATPVEAPDDDYRTDVDAMIARLTPKTKVVFVANPNNPTGTMIGRADIARLHAAISSDTLFVLDQAYAEFLEPEQDDGGLELARSAGNVLITRTFSKIYGLASERIGWGYGPPSVIETMNRIRLPFNVSIAGQAGAIAALDDPDFLLRTRAHTRQWRNWLVDEVNSLSNHGLRAIPSFANFVLVLFSCKFTAESTFNGLMTAGYIVRWLPGQGMPQALRITIGTEDEMRGLVAALRSLVETQGR